MDQPRHINRLESMIFNTETTHRTDLCDGEIKPIVKTVYKEKPRCLRKKPPPLKDHNSLFDWKVPNVPFTLFIKPNEILHMNPREIQEPYHKPSNLDRENVQKTRPRVIMAPFVSMDDFQGSEDRQRLVDDFYTTESMRAANQVLEDIHNVRAPLPTGLPAPPNPITLPKLMPSYVSPEWRMESVTWDGKQRRSYSDSTKNFWLARTPKCQECDDTAARERLKKLRKH